MAVKSSAGLFFWGVVFAGLGAVVWVLGDMLTPFILGLSIAYLLNPVVEKMKRFRVRRWAAALIILSAFLIFVAILLALIIPLAYNQLSALAVAMPGYVDAATMYMEPYIARLQSWIGAQSPENLQTMVKENVGQVVNVGGGLVAGLALGGQALVNFITILVLTPLVAFFMMQEWPRMTAFVQHLYPQEHEAVIDDLFRQIDTKLSGFIRGQLTVAFVLGALYAVALSLAGLNYGFLIGLSAGILSIVPMVGSTVGLVVSLAVAWFQSGDWSYMGVIAAIFIAGQIFEGNFLTPKLVGDSVGLHPLWVLFALMAGGSLFGILGMLLAVPVAAIIGVLGGFGILVYKNSAFYRKSDEKTKAKKTVSKGNDNG